MFDRGYHQLSGGADRGKGRGSEHFTNAFKHVCVGGQGGQLGASQLRHPHLALLGSLLRSHKRDLLLCCDGLRLDLA